jgi:hypothetical protein
LTYKERPRGSLLARHREDVDRTVENFAAVGKAGAGLSRWGTLTQTRAQPFSTAPWVTGRARGVNVGGGRPAVSTTRQAPGGSYREDGSAQKCPTQLQTSVLATTGLGSRQGDRADGECRRPSLRGELIPVGLPWASNRRAPPDGRGRARAREFARAHRLPSYRKTR